jgi:hypothetical protein
MPAFNFRPEFAEAVEWGYKRQTIRADRRDGRPHCKRGDTLKLYTGMRTKSCRLLGTATVTRLARVRIEPTCMYLDGRLLFATLHDRDGPQTDNEFAEADGFSSFMDMSDWFAKTHGLPFEGTVIYWDEPR